MFLGVLGPTFSEKCTVYRKLNHHFSSSSWLPTYKTGIIKSASQSENHVFDISFGLRLIALFITQCTPEWLLSNVSQWEYWENEKASGFMYYYLNEALFNVFETWWKRSHRVFRFVLNTKANKIGWNHLVLQGSTIKAILMAQLLH